MELSLSGGEQRPPFLVAEEQEDTQVFATIFSRMKK